MFKRDKANSFSEAPPPKRIMCVGLCELNIVQVCELYPEEESDRRCLQGYLQRGGNAANNCTVLRLLGSNVEFLGMLSKAEAFTFLEDDYNKRGIKIDNCPTTEIDPPFSSVILVNPTGTRTIIRSNKNFPILTYEYFKRCNMKEYTWVHFEGINYMETIHMMRAAHLHNGRFPDEPIKISVELREFNTDNWVLAELADCVFISKDLALHLGWNTPKAAVYGLRELLRPTRETAGKRPNIVCTWGEDGADCLDSDDKYAHVPGIKVLHVEDSLGAGDTFVGATIHALQDRQMFLEDAVEFANQVAAHKLGYRGYECVAQFRATSTDPGCKIITLKA